MRVGITLNPNFFPISFFLSFSAKNNKTDKITKSRKKAKTAKTTQTSKIAKTRKINKNNKAAKKGGTTPKKRWHDTQKKVARHPKTTADYEFFIKSLTNLFPFLSNFESIMNVVLILLIFSLLFFYIILYFLFLIVLI